MKLLSVCWTTSDLIQGSGEVSNRKTLTDVKSFADSQALESELPDSNLGSLWNLACWIRESWFYWRQYKRSAPAFKQLCCQSWRPLNTSHPLCSELTHCSHGQRLLESVLFFTPLCLSPMTNEKIRCVWGCAFQPCPKVNTWNQDQLKVSRLFGFGNTGKLLRVSTECLYPLVA